MAVSHPVRPRSNAKNHVSGVAKVAEHLVTGQRTPAALGLGRERLEPLLQGPENGWVRDSLEHSCRTIMASGLYDPPQTKIVPE